MYLSDHSLNINCGGSKLKFEGKEYQEDSSKGGASTFYASSERWAYSSTGTYFSNSEANYEARNINVIGGEIYQTARLAPLSLKYYGLCLKKGSYKVRLHFAEIMYTNDQTFSSLGRRIFDVSIQVSKRSTGNLACYLGLVLVCYILKGSICHCQIQRSKHQI